MILTNSKDWLPLVATLIPGQSLDFRGDDLRICDIRAALSKQYPDRPDLKVNWHGSRVYIDRLDANGCVNPDL